MCLPSEPFSVNSEIFISIQRRNGRWKCASGQIFLSSLVLFFYRKPRVPTQMYSDNFEINFLFILPLLLSTFSYDIKKKSLIELDGTCNMYHGCRTHTYSLNHSFQIKKNFFAKNLIQIILMQYAFDAGYSQLYYDKRKITEMDRPNYLKQCQLEMGLNRTQPYENAFSWISFFHSNTKGRARLL